MEFENSTIKKALKKLTAILMVAAMFICAAPLNGIAELDFSALTLSANAEDAAVVETGSCGAEGDNVTYTLYDDGTLIISGEGDMVDYTDMSDIPYADYITIGEGWKAYLEEQTIKKVIIEDGVTSIGREAFSSFVALEKVEIPDSVIKISDAAFLSCSKLTDLDLPENLYTIGDNAFDFCESIEELILPENLTSIGQSAFNGCENIETVIVPDNVTFIGDYAFSGCNNLKSVTLPKDIDKISSYMFGGCGKLSDIIIPEKAEYIGFYSFAYCDSLEEIVVPESVEEILEFAFFDCENLKMVTILNPECELRDSDSIFDSATTIYGYSNSTAQAYAEKYGLAFKVICEHNNTVRQEEIPKTCTLNGYTEGTYCNDCESWIEGHEEIPASHTDENGDKICDICKEEIIVVVETGICEHQDIYTVSYTLYDNGLLVIEGDGYVCSSCFAWRNNIKTIKIENGISSIEGLAFYRCFSLESIDIPESLEDMDYRVFEMCTRLKNINVDENNLYYASESGVLFNKDKTKLVYYPAGKQNTEYSIPGGVNFIGDFSFEYSNAITKVVIPDSVTTIGSNAFECCGNLQNVVMLNGVTNIGASAFRECTSLTSVTIPDSVIEIDEFAFSLCSGLKEVNLPNNLKTISEGLFNYCKSLDKIEIPDNVENIENMAFYGCINLKEITLYNPNCCIFDDESTIWKSATIYGYKNSTAQAYAEKYNRTFVDLEAEVETTVPTTVPTTAPTTQPTTVPTTVEPTTQPTTVPTTVPVTTAPSTEPVTVPTTVAPTTAAPTTKPTETTTSPTTAAPTTTQPTTVAPTTQPTTVAPTTQPATVAPTTQPATVAPTTKPVETTTTKPAETTTTPSVTVPSTEPSTTVHTHTEKVLPAVEATYTKDGLTEGKKCSSCDEILVPQKTVARKKLKKVTSLKVKSTKTTSVKLSWKKVEGAESYKVYYSTNGKNWKSVKAIKNSVTVKKLTSGAEYQFKVKAVAGKYSGSASSVVKSTTKVSAPAVKSVKSSKAKQAVVVWNKVNGANGYVIEYSTSKKFTKKTTKTVKIKKGKTTKTTLKKLKSGKKYYVRIKAYKTVNKKAVYGAYSKVKTVKVK